MKSQQEKRRLYPTTDVIDMLVNAELPERHVTAFAEFIDNSLGEDAGNASEVVIYFDNDKIAIVDNGRGIANMNAMFTIGDSGSRLSRKDIGQFGYGAKVATLYLGWKMKVETVVGGLYHEYEVDWQRVKRAKKFPVEYRGKGVPIEKSSNIQFYGALKHAQSGAAIIIRNRHRGRVWRGEALAQSLAHIFRPALLNKKEISVIDCRRKHRKNEQQEWRLSRSIVRLKLEDEIHGKSQVNGKPFSLYAGRGIFLSSKLNGVHIAFGHRFIQTVNHLVSRHIPSELYAEVQLSESWKKSLGLTKSSIVHDNDRLILEIEKLLTPLIDKIEDSVREIEIKEMVMNLQLSTSKMIEAVNADKEGSQGKGADIESYVNKEGGLCNMPSDSPGDTKKINTQAKGKGESESNEVNMKKPLVGVQLAVAPMKERVFMVTVTETPPGVRIVMNKEIVSFYFLTKDRKHLQFHLGNALLDECWKDPEISDKIFPKFSELIRSGSTPWDAKQQIFYSMLKNSTEPAIGELFNGS